MSHRHDAIEVLTENLCEIIGARTDENELERRGQTLFTSRFHE